MRLALESKANTRSLSYRFESGVSCRMIQSEWNEQAICSGTRSSSLLIKLALKDEMELPYFETPMAGARMQTRFARQACQESLTDVSQSTAGFKPRGDGAGRLRRTEGRGQAGSKSLALALMAC